ncbi:hypothetical protein ABXI76_05085 [Streptomyces parvus]
MTEIEMMQRVVGILTQSRELLSDSEDGDNRDVQGREDTMLQELIAGAFDVTVSVEGEPTLPVVTKAVMDQLAPRIGLMVGCFAAAFTRLADYHEAGRSDVSPTEVLQELMLDTFRDCAD